MKHLILRALTLCILLPLTAVAQSDTPSPATPPAASPTEPVATQPAAEATPSPVPATKTTPSVVKGEIHLNFQNASLADVLNYLSDAAGFIIVQDTPVAGTVNVVSKQPVSVDDAEDLPHWPLLISGLAQSWNLSDQQVSNLREFLLRGGFLFCDSFYGDRNWAAFAESLKRVLPDRPIIDLTDDHPVFHAAFDLPHMTSVQISNMNSLMAGGPGYLSGGRTPHWRGVADETGRLMVLIAFNNDVADAWQWADDPRYPADQANLALRLGANIAVYALTH